MIEEVSTTRIQYSNFDDFIDVIRRLKKDVPENARWELSDFEHGDKESVCTVKFSWKQTNAFEGVFNDLSDSRTDRARILKAIPSLAFVHPDTKFWIYGEYLPRHDAVEYTVYYREPVGEKMRIDAHLFAHRLEDSDGPVGPHNLSIKYWGPAVVDAVKERK